MEIQLKELPNGRTKHLQSDEKILDKIKQMQKLRNFQEVLRLSQQMQEGVQKYFLACDALLQMKKWKQLVQFCDKGLKIKEESEFYHHKGKALGKLGDDKKKIRLILKAIEMNPQVAAYHRNIGAAYYSEKDYSKAIEHHQKASQLEPSNASNYHNLGTSYFRIKELSKAKTEFKKAIQTNPKQTLSYSWLGDCFKQEQDLQKALECYQKAFQLSHSAFYLKEKEKIQQMIEKGNQQ